MRNESRSTEQKVRRPKTLKAPRELPEFNWKAPVEAKLSGHTHHNSVSSSSSSASSDYTSCYSSSSAEVTAWMARVKHPGKPRSIYQPLSIPVEQQAISFFFANYVLMPRQQGAYGYMSYLVPLMNEFDAGATFALSLSAVALAAMGNRPSTKTILPIASQQYTKALRQVNNALTDSKLAKLDHTLASVLLLGLFETICSSHAHGGWNNHMSGAAALVKIRLSEAPNIQTAVAQELHLTVRAQMIPYCIVNSKGLEQSMDWWMSIDTVKLRGCNNLNLSVVDLKTRTDALLNAPQRTPSNLKMVLELICEAQVLEEHYLVWIASLPSYMAYQTVAWNDNMTEEELAMSNCFSGKIDMYAGMWLANLWNMSRACRLLLSQLLVRCTAWLHFPRDYRTTPEYRKAAHLGETLIADMIASVPNFIGGLPTECLKKPDATHTFACGEDMRMAGKGVSSLFLLWPLIAAATSDFATEAQRRWIIAKLQGIGQSLGINQGALYPGFHRRQPSMMVERDRHMYKKMEKNTDLICDDWKGIGALGRSDVVELEAQVRQWER
ncbi:hypothetical protein PVAG01_03078 [Phlyctema vagabunda]|uniref:Uncharacterized protein n=1 Tax=Phlyctema vagabunda TaxID=108571 RepID=A0ABR4PSI7_9HELO